MNQDFLYFLFGLFDALAVWICILAPFKLPIYRYRWILLGSSLLISVLSYLNRMVLPLSAVDLPMQFVLFVIFCRYLLKIRLFWSTLIVVTGYMLYIPVQFGLYYLLICIGTFTDEVLSQNTGYVFLLQLASILAIYVIGLGIKLAGKGFSFIQPPPHDFSVKENYFSSANEKLLIGIAVGVIYIAFSMMLILKSFQLIILPGALLASMIVYSVIWSRDRNHSRAEQGEAETRQRGWP